MAAQSSWMDAAFALDELHCDPDFAELKAAVDDMQRRKVLGPGGSDIETLSAFLDEMEQLDIESLMPASDASTLQSLCQPPILDASTDAGAVVPPARKKKLSSTERQKRNKAELLERLVQLQLQLQGLQTEQQQMNAQYDVERQREQHETQRTVDTNLQIRQALMLEQNRSGQVAMLLNQLSTPMKVTTCRCDLKN